MFLISNSILLESAEGNNPSTQGIYKRDTKLGRRRTQIQKIRKIKKSRTVESNYPPTGSFKQHFLQGLISTLNVILSSLKRKCVFLLFF